MKYLGQSDKDCIVLLSKEEFANLLGDNYQDEKKWNAFKLGQPLEIHEAWSCLKDLSRSKRRLRGISDDLREIANIVDTKHPQIEIVKLDK